MIIRRASEIIRLALTMSQINNTDALSWRDKIDMLNQSYIRLYTDLNNSGDLYYSKEIVFDSLTNEDGQRDNRIKLPKDFWKLLTLGYRSNIRGDIIPIERAPNSGQYFSGYKIINNEVLFDNFFTPGLLVLRYIPQPQTITYPRQGYAVAGKAVQAAYDSLNDVIVLGNAGDITVINRPAGKVASIAIADEKGNVPYILAVSKGIIYAVTKKGIFLYDYDLNAPIVFEGPFDLYAHSIGWEEGIITSMNGIILKYIAGSKPVESVDYWNFLDGNITRTEKSEYVFLNESEIIDITEIFQGDSFVIADPYIYINKNGSVKVYDNFEPADFAPATVGKGIKKGIVLGAEANNDSGYGVIFKDFYSGLNMEGFASDTVMNYPMNTFFDFLTADLAVKFRIALDIPTGELPALVSDYHDTLMRSISRDAFKAQRINNAYGRTYL